MDIEALLPLSLASLLADCWYQARVCCRVMSWCLRMAAFLQLSILWARSSAAQAQGTGARPVSQGVTAGVGSRFWV